MGDLFRPAIVVGIALLIPILPFLGFGAQIEEGLTHWSQNPPDPAVATLAVVGLLATDIFLPIPSSVISTLSAYQLGVVLGTLASWIGLTLGAVLGFAAARRWGRAIALRFTRAEDLARLDALSSEVGPHILVATRAVPILAEASVLLVGMHRLSWRRFLWPVVLGNLGISLVYGALGHLAGQYNLLLVAIAVSIAVPVLLTIVARHWAPPRGCDTAD